MATHSRILAWKNPMNGGAWWATVHGVAKSQTRLSNFTFTFTWAFVAAQRLSLAVAWASHYTGFSSLLCSGRAGTLGRDSVAMTRRLSGCMGSRVSRFQQLRLSSTGLGALQHVKFSQTRDRTHALNHWTTREVHNFFLLRRTFEIYSLSNLTIIQYY